MNAPMTLRARAQAPVKEVHQALTDPAAMKVWLAEHAEVEPGRYVFWGRYTPEGETPRQRLSHLDDTSVRFDWTLDGEDTTVELSLAEDGGATIVTLTQTNLPDHGEAIGGGGSRHVMSTYWSMAIANLVDHVEGREITMLCDFTDPAMRVEVLVDAARSEVYQSLIDSEKFRRWFGANVGIEPFVGGRFAMGGFDMDPSPAKVVELEPDSKCVLSWGDGQMTASWELADSGGKTRLTFVQSGFGDTDYGAWLGWMSGVAELRRFLELPNWRPIWVSVDIEGMPEGMLYSDQG
ncbi:SRPBCC family protein [Actinomadura barringtoniae]|nr:SRPBCC family protein [Actinomadura barringtoniae]